MRRLALAAALAALPGYAAAQQAFPAPGDDVIVTLGVGPKLQPAYEGADKYVLAPFPVVGLKFLVNPFTGEPSNGLGFGVAPAFRYLERRSVGVDKRLAGLDPVSAAFEVGINLDYTWEWGRAFVEARQGFGGHSGEIFDLGLQGILRPAPNVKIMAGPQVSFATRDYMDTYFSVTAKEALASGLPAYKADGGFRSYGALARVDWDVTPQWLVRLEGTWNRLSGDAGDSPIVKRIGDANQFTIGLGAAYRFGIDYK